ncbi:2-amino-4-hydroxy-6-hydroxymethyldihydropteridine diphosphokinase [Capilliphycus salinus ALCB114379]|uniref:2-amino-4-hydroxy-6- hydroxymethyldihydropteridine diphosphokinase n=1 Tax=Capilliphycus salinus TaxID=2768948 RepID=UPI0039A61E86
MNSAQVAIALGSNLGDSLATVKMALELLDNRPGIAVKSCSSWYQTAPVGPPQPNYINGCAILTVENTQETPAQTAEMFMQILLNVEAQFGRVRRERWGPRTLDLDLLLFDDLILQTPTLEIPHPRMRERAFVLVPLAEIAPHWIDPVSGKDISQLVESLDCSGVYTLSHSIIDN